MSRHFQPREFACPHCGVIHLEPLLPARLERLRALAGGEPIRIVSGYRCAVHNRAVGGARDSQHLHGRAADLLEGAATLEQAWTAGFTGVGTRGDWATHVDVRPGAFTTWSYGGA
jgi:uncharacterized protein YcbK (DUF882 family)